MPRISASGKRAVHSPCLPDIWKDSGKVHMRPNFQATRPGSQCPSSRSRGVCAAMNSASIVIQSMRSAKQTTRPTGMACIIVSENPSAFARCAWCISHADPACIAILPRFFVCQDRVSYRFCPIAMRLAQGCLIVSAGHSTNVSAWPSNAVCPGTYSSSRIATSRLPSRHALLLAHNR